MAKVNLTVQSYKTKFVYSALSSKAAIEDLSAALLHVSGEAAINVCTLFCTC